MQQTDDDFNARKKMILERVDKSKKGSIDQDIIPLLDKINTTDDYYTTSSCSGRINFFKGEKKYNCEWLYTSHEIVDEWPEINEEEYFAKAESVLLHIACRSLDFANRLLEKVRRVCKKSYILSLNKKIMVEIGGSYHLTIPIKKNSLTEELKEFYLDKLNHKLKLTKMKIKELENLF